jgi:hypothetical protein
MKSRKVKKAVALPKRTGTIAIPNFGSPNNNEFSDTDYRVPGCCGILVVSGFGHRPLEHYDVGDKFNDNIDVGLYYNFGTDEGTYGPDRYLEDTERLTRAEARRWWDRLCECHDVACLMATTTPGQRFAETNLEAAGWKRIGRQFHSATSGNAITIWQYLHSDWK